MREQYGAFQEAGVEIVAVAVANASTIDQGVRRVINPPYPLLADPDHEVAEAFGVYELVASGYAAPSVFVIDTDRSIVWSYVGRDRGDRPSVADVLENLP